MTNQELLKAYSAYLPYKLKCSNSKESYLQTGKDRIGALQQISVNDDCLILNEGGYFLVHYSEIVPILRPLSDLEKEILHNGEKFVPALELVKEKEKYKKWNDNAPTIDYDIKIVKKPFGKILKVSKLNQWVVMFSFDEPERSEYFIIQKLLEWHFDVFSLIDKGLALNLNDLKDE